MSTRQAGVERAKIAALRGLTRAKKLGSRVLSRPTGRAVQRYLENNGNVLAGGIAYYSLASIAAGVVLAVSVASYIVLGNESYRQYVFDFVGNAIPGLFPSASGPGLVDPETITPTPATGVVGLISLGVLLFTATRYLRGLRAAVRSMLGSAGSDELAGTLRDLIAFVGLALIAVLAAALQVVSTAFGQAIARVVGDEGSGRLLITLGAAGVAVLANSAFVALVFLVLGRSRVRARVVIPTILATALVIAILQQASGYFVASASGNAVLQPFAAIIALLLFVDFTARVLLIGSAYLGAAFHAGAPDVPVKALESPARRRVAITTVRGRRRDRSPQPPGV